MRIVEKEWPVSASASESVAPTAKQGCPDIERCSQKTSAIPQRAIRVGDITTASKSRK